ncbi:tripartite motif-containing protein 59-like [Cyprinus carpio]|uniref:Tripartite motif-containing protein 59-like n=1 Tax=Cyprinus carpio TaxID=7962 RepID=A0A9Q9VTF4_CYPCA|nr:tripartite motif-containing protein 59-like [Cyprinus carpio]
MASLHVSAEELSCPVCCEIFKTPLLLSCSHSVCKECLHQFWRTKKTQECPVCRSRSSKPKPPVNLALQNLCESFLKERKESRSSGSKEICSLHSEKLKLFCLEDKQPVCVECVTSQQHISHAIRPINEAVPSNKEALYTSLMVFPKKIIESIKGMFVNTGQHNKNINNLIKKSILIEDGNPVQYRLQTSTDNLNQYEPYRKISFGERDNNKSHNTILLVGETGTGKTKLINVMINYILGVQREDKVWFEITDDQSDRTSVHSQTSSITVYEFYLEVSHILFMILVIKGYGDTRGVELDKEIAESLLSLSKSAEGVHEVDAVCLANIKCPVNDKNQPVFFLFNNCQTDAADEDFQTFQEQSWNLSFRGMEKFFQFLEKIKPKTLKMTQDVLQQRKQLEANISNLQSRVHMTELKENELKKTLEQDRKKIKDNKNFEFEVDVPYKKKVDIDCSLAKMATCCTNCEENCHYPGCCSNCIFYKTDEESKPSSSCPHNLLKRHNREYFDLQPLSLVQYGSCTAADKKSIQRTVRTAEKIIKTSLLSIQELQLHAATKIISDSTHPTN